MSECRRVECMGNGGCIDACWNKEQPLLWAHLMRGVRVEGDTVVISTKDNDAARELCGALIEEMNK